jgi:hypothetical protein
MAILIDAATAPLGTTSGPGNDFPATVTAKILLHLLRPAITRLACASTSTELLAFGGFDEHPIVDADFDIHPLIAGRFKSR